MDHYRESDYGEQIQYLFGLSKYGIKFGLSSTTHLLESLGNPHVGQSYVHIAGTNGKGSVSAFLASIFRKAGLKVGFYSSPHLVRFTERFQINGREMPRETATELIKELRRAILPKEPPTFFEVATAMALAYFAREKTDLAVIEVGMGGRLDATNIITPHVTVITNISLEHQAYLGPHLLDIAKEKAGIIKERTDLVTAAQQPQVLHLFESMCRERQAPFWRIGREIRYRLSSSGLHYYGINSRHKGLKLGLRGEHQGRNASLALAATELLARKGFVASEEHIREGLRTAVWPGRMQVVARHPTIILDGGHNPGALKVLARSVQREFDYERLILVIGIMHDKDIRQCLGQIVPVADVVIYTRPVYSRAADPTLLSQEAEPLNRPGEVITNLSKALNRAKAIANPRDLILVTGSLFTVGEALTYFDPETHRPDDVH